MKRNSRISTIPIMVQLYFLQSSFKLGSKGLEVEIQVWCVEAVCARNAVPTETGPDIAQVNAD